MSGANGASDLSMDEILASIRKIIAEDPKSGVSAGAPSAQTGRRSPARLEPVAPPRLRPPVPPGSAVPSTGQGPVPRSLQDAVASAMAEPPPIGRPQPQAGVSASSPVAPSTRPSRRVELDDDILDLVEPPGLRPTQPSTKIEPPVEPPPIETLTTPISEPTEHRLAAAVVTAPAPAPAAPAAAQKPDPVEQIRGVDKDLRAAMQALDASLASSNAALSVPPAPPAASVREAEAAQPPAPPAPEPASVSDARSPAAPAAVASPVVARHDTGPQTAAEKPRTLEDAVAEMLRPMLRQWLDDNMPRIVEKALREEMPERLARRRD